MKFKTSTLLWLATVAAVATAGVVSAYRERMARQTITLRSNEQALLHERQFSDLSKTLQQVQLRENHFRELLGIFPSNLTTSTDCRLIRLDSKPSSAILGTSPQLNHQWRIFLPKSKSPIHLCWAFKNIPVDDGLPQGETKIQRQTVDVRQTSISAQSGKRKYRWLGTGLITFATHLSGDSTKAGIETGVTVEAAPLANQTSFENSQGSGVFQTATDCDWLFHHRNFPSSMDAIESQEINELPNEIFSLDRPLVLVKIRGKRKLDDGTFETVDGPSPGLLVWLEPIAAPPSD